MSSLGSDFRAMFDWRSLAVLRRNAKVYLRNWRTAFFPPAMEPIVMFLSLGLGLGGYVSMQGYGGASYPSYLAPGLMAYTAFTTPFFEGLYSAYVRMFYQKTWDGMLATQLEMRHIVWGEILWTGLRGAMNVVAVALVLFGFDLLGLIAIDSRMLVVAPPLAFVAGCAFGAFALIFTAIVPSIDHMNYPTFLVGVPLGLVSDTYFPIHPSHPVLAFLADLNPIRHLAQVYRGLLLGQTEAGPFWKLAVTTSVALLLLSLTAQRRIRKRVLSE
ncbi:MAG: ABC transporter permease [Myxococcales bacterium]|nr:ABC transporter permease [Myxococcales bacterium]